MSADAPVSRTTISRCVEGEYQVRAYDAHGNRMPRSDYFTDDLDDARATAAAMKLQRCQEDN